MVNEDDVDRAEAPRYSPQAQQEDRSITQIRGWFADLYWSTTKIERDVGEDLFVSVYENGASVGVHFLVQCKSTTDLQALVDEGPPEVVRYRFKVSDLLHWKKSEAPVMVLLWDVETRVGCWMLVTHILQQLNARDEGWTAATTVTAYFPRSNDTGPEAVKKLRRFLGDHYLPLHDKDRVKITASFSFPPSPEGQAGAAAFQNAIDKGDAVVVDGAFIESLQVSRWLERLYGKLEKPPHIEIQPIAAPVPALRLEVDSSEFEQPMVLPYVDMHRIKAGQKEVTLSNAHQGTPVQVTLVVRRRGPEPADVSGCSIRFEVRALSSFSHAHEAREVAQFALALATAKRVGLTFATGREGVFEGDPGPARGALPLEVLRARARFLEMLSFIQKRIEGFGRIDVAAALDGGPEDLKAVKMIHAILKTGEIPVLLMVDQVMDCPMTRDELVEKMRLHRDDPHNREHWFTSIRDVQPPQRLLNVSVPLGVAEVFFCDSIPLYEQIIAGRDKSPEGGVQVRVPNLSAIYRFPEWMPGGAYAPSA